MTTNISDKTTEADDAISALPSNHSEDAESPKRSAFAKFWAKTMTLIKYTAYFLAIAYAAAVYVIPLLLGGHPAMTVLTGSMEPNIMPGDMIVNARVDPETLKVGDVISYQPEDKEATNGMPIVHRVTKVIKSPEGTVDAFVTKGDANKSHDPLIFPEQVVGRIAYTMPNVGNFYLATYDLAWWRPEIPIQQKRPL